MPIAEMHPERWRQISAIYQQAAARTGKDRLGKATARIDLIVCAHDVVALRTQLLCHAVEGLAKMGEIALGVPHRHADEQIAGGDGIRGADQAPDRRDQPIGEIEPDPDRGEEDDQGDHGVHQRERNLDTHSPR